MFGPKGTVLGPGGVVKNFNSGTSKPKEEHEDERRRKIKFTQIHNAHDSASPYLGVDRSSHNDLRELVQESSTSSDCEFSALQDMILELIFLSSP